MNDSERGTNVPDSRGFESEQAETGAQSAFIDAKCIICGRELGAFPSRDDAREAFSKHYDRYHRAA